MSSACHCRSRTPLGRDGYMRTLLYTRTLRKLDLSKHCYESNISSDCTQWLNLSKLRQFQLLGPPSHDCSWRIQTSSCQRAISYQRYKYNNDLSEGLSVINDTINLNKGLPVINDTTDLSEGLPVINDTNAKMTCVVDDLCGYPFNQRLMTCGH